MSDSQKSPVFLYDGDDPEMQRAHEDARASFRYFWRELAWERRRIVPALDMAAVKAPFFDDASSRPKDQPEAEHMWLSEIDFDGQFVSGVLLNEPNWVKGVKAGDSARIPLNEISDWMYVIAGEVFGAYTVNLLRSRMNRQERREHDEAWGLNFGDPAKIRAIPERKQGGGPVKNWFGKKQADSHEHPASEAMAANVKEMVAKNPAMLSKRDDNGWTCLHHDALAGNAAIVQILLEAGADPQAKTNHGMTPIQLARSLGWEKVAALLAHQ